MPRDKVNASDLRKFEWCSVQAANAILGKKIDDEDDHRKQEKAFLTWKINHTLIEDLIVEMLERMYEKEESSETLADIVLGNKEALRERLSEDISYTDFDFDGYWTDIVEPLIEENAGKVSGYLTQAMSAQHREIKYLREDIDFRAFTQTELNLRGRPDFIVAERIGKILPWQIYVLDAKSKVDDAGILQNIAGKLLIEDNPNRITKAFEIDEIEFPLRTIFFEYGGAGWKPVNISERRFSIKRAELLI